MPKILLIDDHAIVRNGALEAVKLMGWLPDVYTHVVQADSVELALTITPEAEDLALIDIGVPEKHATLITFDERERCLGFEIARQWRLQAPQLAIIFFSGVTNLVRPLQKTLKVIGAYRVAYLPKDGLLPEDLRPAWETIRRGEVYLHPAVVDVKYPEAAHFFVQSRPHQMRYWIETVCDKLPTLTERKLEVLHAWQHGLSQSEIGKRLYISERTVERLVEQSRDTLLEDFRALVRDNPDPNARKVDFTADMIIRDALTLYDLLPPTFQPKKQR